MYCIVNRRYVGDHVPRNLYTNIQFYTIAYYGIQMVYIVLHKILGKLAKPLLRKQDENY